MSTAPAADVIRTRGTAVPEPSPEQLDALLREFSEQPPGPRRAALRDHVIRLLLPMARRVTRRFRRHGEEFDDLVQVASLGLIKAVDGYDPTLGHAFLSYALPKVTGELRRHLRDRTAVVRLPRPLQEASGQIFQAVEELEQRLGGRSPTAEQIAEHTGLGRGRVLSALRAVRECRARSLDEPTGHDQREPFTRPAGAEDPALGRVVDTVALTSLVKQLPERDRHVLYLRFYRECTQQQIADAVGVSQMQVSRILRRCLGRLREALEAGEPCAEGGEERARGPVGGRTIRPAHTSRGPRGPAEPVRPAGSAGPARPAPRSTAHARPVGPAATAVIGAVRRHPVPRRSAGTRRPPVSGSQWHTHTGTPAPTVPIPVAAVHRRHRRPVPRRSPVGGSRWRACSGAAPRTRAAPATVRRGERVCRTVRPPPPAARTHEERKHLPRPGLCRPPPAGTDAGTRADEGAHREASPAYAPARMALAGRPDPDAARP